MIDFSIPDEIKQQVQMAGVVAKEVMRPKARYYDEARKLEWAAMLGDVPADVVRWRFSNHPLHDAMKQRDIQAVQRPFKSGVSRNLKDASGNTPLHWAIVRAGGLI